MADLAVWQRTIVDETGLVVPGAEIEVRHAEGGALAQLYQDREGTQPLSNPVTADMSGFVRFFIKGGAYDITATGSGASRTWRFDATGRLKEFDKVVAEVITDDAGEQADIRDKLGTVTRTANLSDLADLKEARSNLGTFSTVADVENSHIPAVIDSIRTDGYYDPGDGGGALYVKGDEGPGAIQSADGSWWAIKPVGDLDARQLGLSGSQSDSERRKTLQDAIDLAADLGARLRIPALLDGSGNPQPWVLGSITITEDGIQKPVCLRWHSGSYIYGDGKGHTILKLADDAIDNVNLLEPSARDGSVINWVIEDMTLDGNASRPNVTGTGSFRRPGASCIATASASFGSIRRVEARHAVLHCIDVCSGGAINGGTEYYVDPDDRGVNFYPGNQSTFVWVEDCEAWDAGDDAFTVHYARKVWFTRCYAHTAGDRHSTSTACNGFEMDDGARDVWVTDCYARDVNRAFTAKGHANDPSAHNVFFSGVWADACAVGLWCDAPSGAAGNRDVTAHGLKVTNPTNRGISGGGEQGGQQVRAVWVSRYHNVQVSGLTAVGNVGDNTLEAAVVAGSSSDGFHLSNFHIENWPEEATSNANRAGIYTTSTAHNVLIENGVILNCGWRGIRRGGEGICNIINVAVIGDNKPNSVGVDLNQNAALEGSTILGLNVSGYTNEMAVGGRTGVVTSVFNNLEFIRGTPSGADSSGGTIYARRSNMWLEAENNIRSQTIRDTTTGQSANVWISDGNGTIMRSTSARKYKTDIREIDLETAKAFFEGADPVSFRSLCDADEENTVFYGYIADDVAQVDPRLVRFNAEGEPEGFNYDRVPALLHVVMRDLQARIEALESRLEQDEGS